MKSDWNGDYGTDENFKFKLAKDFRNTIWFHQAFKKECLMCLNLYFLLQ